MNDNWLSDIVIVNESSDYNEVGDISIFRSFGDACHKVEYWYGAEAEYFAFSGNGIQLVFGADGNRTTLNEIAPKNVDIKIIMVWLNEWVRVNSESRQIKAKKKKVILGNNEALGVFPESLEGMVTYLGFDK